MSLGPICGHGPKLGHRADCLNLETHTEVFVPNGWVRAWGMLSVPGIQGHKEERRETPSAELKLCPFLAHPPRVCLLLCKSEGKKSNKST